MRDTIRQEGAGEEGCDGNERLEPAVRFRLWLIGGAEGKEHGVASLHGGKDGPGVVGGGIDETRDEGGSQEEQVGMGGVDEGGEEGCCFGRGRASVGV